MGLKKPKIVEMHLLWMAYSIEIAMARRPESHEGPRTDDDVRGHRTRVRENTQTRLVTRGLGRTPDAGHQEASKQGTSLKPTTQSRYNRRKQTTGGSRFR
jgi:hypothetical protein